MARIVIVDGDEETTLELERMMSALGHSVSFQSEAGAPRTEDLDIRQTLRALARTSLDSAPMHAHRWIIEQLDVALIVEALTKTGGHLARSAALLGISRPTLREKIVRHHLERRTTWKSGPREEDRIERG